MTRTGRRVVAIIPARGGSKGLPGKNLAPLAGVPLIAHTIRHARESGVIDRVIVSTDSEEIAAVARRYGAEAPFLRPAELAQDLTPTEPVLQHALRWIEEEDRNPVDIVVFLQPTDVFRAPEMIRSCVRLLLENPRLESAFVGYRTHKNFWRRVDGRLVKLAADIPYGPRQTREHLYREETGLACASRAWLIRQGRRVGDVVEVVPTDDERINIDIHDPYDLWLADKVMTEWQGEDE
jgi:CMP-N-acetylneuraminic acid synthetase